MARAIWNGAISFGLVTIPVQLVSAVRRLLRAKYLGEELGDLSTVANPESLSETRP